MLETATAADLEIVSHALQKSIEIGIALYPLLWGICIIRAMLRW
jgi:hypothetical protein